MLIAKCVHCPDFVSIAEGKFRFGLVIRVQMGILDAMLGFKAHPFDIVFLRLGMLHRTHGYMNGIPRNLIYRDVFLPGR